MRIDPYFTNTRHAAIFKDGEELNRCNMKNGLEIMAPVGGTLYFGEIIDCWDYATITCLFTGLSGSRVIPCENLRIIPGSFHAYKPEDFKHGQKFTAKYKGQRIGGAVSISGGEIYLCQNVENGKYTKEKLGFDFSYVIYDGRGPIDPFFPFTELRFDYEPEAKINPVTFEPVTDEWVEMTGGDMTLGKTVKHRCGIIGIITRLDSGIVGIKWECHSYDSSYTSIIFKNLLVKSNQTQTIKPNTNEKREHKSIEVCRPVATITSGQRRPGNTVSGRGSKTTISRGHHRHKAIDSAAW